MASGLGADYVDKACIARAEVTPSSDMENVANMALAALAERNDEARQVAASGLSRGALPGLP